ncbi:Bro-N domain-containing protein [Pseudomonas fontis]|uniref:Bro-N domain-containing protein n=1 Tax=Pseudomonas fontis TaxID=2942633 RepID=A0ABT5NTV5_9PSED|nr:Bro-N domain-containing protein [Pseudomonas fontis]MDD0976134.1 Bro-N domain-containing protein [Pseudomonas fontis]MDD0991579.1 Bro-N domain-containing protein [Pseudomonas fontis]
MTDLYDPLLFTRHNRPLHALWLESQAWFCARELGRLIGRYLDEQIIRRLDADQHRVLTLLRYGEYRETMMISESGAYTVLAHHYIPENRVLRHWLTHDVVAVLRDRRDGAKAVAPHVDRLNWSGRSLALLHWQSEPWIRLRDMPQLLSKPPGRERRSASWRQTAARLLGI